jgi:4-hydroxybenzoate polyprenyltransferase
MIWPIIYDTYYAMADRDDDIKIGVKSTAILFGEYDTLCIGVLQIVFVMCLIGVGIQFDLSGFYYSSIVMAAVLFCYQQLKTRSREPSACFAAFLQNNWVGFILFSGILLSYLQ